MTKKERMKIYRRRQAFLIAGIAIVLIMIIICVVLLFSMGRDDKKTETQTAGTTSPQTTETAVSATLPEASEELPAGGREDDGSVPEFTESRIKIKVGETYTVRFAESNDSGEYEWESTDPEVAAVDEYGVITGTGRGSCDITARLNGTDKTAKLRVVVESEDGEDSEEPDDSSEHSITEEDGLTYIDGILIANKTYSLPADYDPGADSEALAAFEEMASDAAAEGLSIYISSGYRSYYDQQRIYNNYVARDGQEIADTYSSRPGHSDHQTGLAFDLNSIDDSFGYTPESDWVAANAHRYGFIIRFPEGKEAYTGYQYEPWHIRYLGIEKATEVYESGLSLEEFLGIDSEYRDQ